MSTRETDRRPQSLLIRIEAYLTYQQFFNRLGRDIRHEDRFGVGELALRLADCEDFCFGGFFEALDQSFAQAEGLHGSVCLGDGGGGEREEGSGGEGVLAGFGEFEVGV